MGNEEAAIYWHPAFDAAMRLDLKADRQWLDFYTEHIIGKRPLKIDMLVIKKAAGVELSNEIGKLFRGHNIFEYKSSDDSLNVDVYAKAMSYAYLYKSLEEHVDDVRLDDITITFIREVYPQKLAEWFKSEKFVVEKRYPGVYYVLRERHFPIQIIALEELDRESHICLAALTEKLEAVDARRLAEFVAELTEKGDKDNAGALLDVTMRANKNLYDMVKEDDAGMCEALREFFKDELEEANATGRNEGMATGLTRGRSEGMATGLTKGKAEDIIDLLEDCGEVSDALREIIYEQKNLDVLRKWLRLASRAESVAEFEEAVGLVR